MCGVGKQTEPRESTCFAEIKNTIKSKTKKAIKTKNLYFNKWSNERRQLQYRLHIDDGLNPSMTISYINIIFYLQIKKNLSRRNREIWESKRRVLRGRSVCSERHCKVVSYIPGIKMVAGAPSNWNQILRRIFAGTFCSKSGNTCWRNMRYFWSFRRSSNRYGPIKGSWIISAHTYTENLCWLALKRAACGFTASHTWLLCVLNTPSHTSM